MLCIWILVFFINDIVWFRLQKKKKKTFGVHGFHDCCFILQAKENKLLFIFLLARLHKAKSVFGVTFCRKLKTLQAFLSFIDSFKKRGQRNMRNKVTEQLKRDLDNTCFACLLFFYFALFIFPN